MHGEVLVSVHLKSDMHGYSRGTSNWRRIFFNKEFLLLLLLLTYSPYKKLSLHNFGDITLYLEYSLYDLMCHIRLGASSLSESKSLMVSSANTLAHHILNHLHFL